MDENRRDTLGIFLGFLGGIGMGGSHYVLSILATRLNAMLVMWYISITLFIISLFLAMQPSIFSNFPKNEFPMLMVRSMASIGGRLTIIMAFAYVPVYEGDMVRCTETIFITFMGWCILKQPIRCSMSLALIFSIIGIFMIYRPPWLIPGSEFIIEQVSIKNRVIGIGIALLSAILISVYKTLAKLIPTMHYRVVCIYETWLHVVIITPICFGMGLFQMPQNLLDWLLPCSVGVTYTIAILCYTQAFKFTEAAYAGFASMSFLPTSIILKTFVEHKPPNKYDFIGIFCIITSVAISLFATQLAKLTDWLKRKLCCPEPDVEVALLKKDVNGECE